MRRPAIITAIITMMLALPEAAHATYWQECRVTAAVEETGTPGVYSLSIEEAVVTDGHEEPGTPCLQDQQGDNLEVPVQGEARTGAGVELHYSYYDSLGPEGVIVEQNWRFVTEGDEPGEGGAP